MMSLLCFYIASGLITVLMHKREVCRALTTSIDEEFNDELGSCYTLVLNIAIIVCVFVWPLIVMKIYSVN